MNVARVPLQRTGDRAFRARFGERDQGIGRRCRHAVRTRSDFPSAAFHATQDASFLEDVFMASPLFDLSGKVAVVTGSSKGIGKSIALHLALQGAKVVVSSRKKPACDQAAAEIRKAGGEAIVIPCNISDKAQVENLIGQTKKQLGPVDVLVCNAATNPYYGPTDKMPDDVFMKIMQNNILSNIWLITNCLPDMRAKKDGSIIIVSSIGGLRGTPVIGAYGI